MGQRALSVGDTQRRTTDRITEAMRRRDVSARTLATTLGTSHSRVSAVLRGERAMTTDEMTQMCSALGLTAWQVLRDIEHERAQEAAARPD